jgi:capsid protein
MGIASGMLNPPLDIDPETIFNAVYIGPVMPWIDPEKESKAAERSIKSGLGTEAEYIRKRGLNPQELKRQRTQEIKDNKENDLIYSSDYRHEVIQKQQSEAPPPEPEPED